MTDPLAPRYEHDCEACELIGAIGPYDIYLHTGEYPTIVARFGNDGPEYLSGIDLKIRTLAGR